jgi:hypothetical protein
VGARICEQMAADVKYFCQFTFGKYLSWRKEYLTVRIQHLNGK